MNLQTDPTALTEKDKMVKAAYDEGRAVGHGRKYPSRAAAKRIVKASSHFERNTIYVVHCAEIYKAFAQGANA